jgi:hypothetical protein
VIATALSIEVEIEMSVEKKQAEIVSNLLKLNSLWVKQIAGIAKVSVEFVEEVRKNII